MPGERDHSIWVGDLTPEVDDLQFYKFFSARFQTVKSAKGNIFDVQTYIFISPLIVFLKILDWPYNLSHFYDFFAHFKDWLN